MTNRRRRAIIRRRIFIGALTVLLAVIIALLAVVIGTTSDFDKGDSQSYHSSQMQASSDLNVDTDNKTDSSDIGEEDDLPSTFTTPTGVTLDADFSRLLLTNGKNPLPDDYDTNVRDYLVEIDPKYRNNNNVTKIHKDVHPYITAMVAAAQSEGIELRVWSPFRSYAIQEELFRKQVERVGDEGVAATVVARPGTSEHNTGLCADFNMASDAFESTPMFAWMQENAENYGFVLRYPADKQGVTGVIYESWHWRFVGINTAKEMNELGYTLEEYIEYKGLEPTVDMYTDDK